MANETGTVGGVLRGRCRREPDAPLIKIGGEWITSGALDASSRALASGLSGLGTTKGDRVAWMLPNRAEVPSLLFALARLGAIQVPLNPFLKGDFLAYQLDDCGASVLVTDAVGHRSAVPLLGSTSIKHVVVVGEEPVDDPNAIRFEELKDPTSEPPPVEVDASDIFSLLYTSGTTGMPKGCMLSHGYYTTAGRMFGELEMVVPGDRVLTAFPLFHAGGQMAPFMGSLSNDASVCIEPEFSAAAFMRRVREEEATVVLGVGAIAMAVLATQAAADDRDHRLRLAMFAPLAVEQQLAFEERFGVRVSSAGYGQTECNPITLTPVIDDAKRHTMGRPLPHLDVRIVDDGGDEVPAGTVGELVVRPRDPGVSTLFSGYWDKPEATVAVWASLWHHTGDFATMDADGFVTFVDRKKDALRRRGENISSFELEAAIAAHPGVARVAVCAVPSPLGEDDIKACIVPVDGLDLTPETLFAYFKDTLPYFAIPRYAHVRPSLPETAATHRIMKYVLRDEGVTPDCWDFEALGLKLTKAERRG